MCGTPARHVTYPCPEKKTGRMGSLASLWTLMPGDGRVEQKPKMDSEGGLESGVYENDHDNDDDHGYEHDHDHDHA